ncbi:hypothetical protein OIU78_026733 [Salix suchowensis]|nr:hypothetical protein OIU78_026733 [Salix suchowensis]
MEPATSLSTIFHQLSDHPMKRFRASHAVSKIIRMLSGLIRKLMASDVVVYVVEWFNEQNVTALVAVAVIGQTMKAPGQDFRIPRDDFEANPSDI